MATAPPPLSLRLGPGGLKALDEIAKRRGISRTEAARQAIAETAERERRKGGLAAEPTRVLCEMVGTIYARNLGQQVAHVGHDELRAVDDALLLVLGLG